MTTIEQIIENFKGTTFSSHEDVEKWLRQALEQVEKETREKDIEVVENYDLLADASSALTEGINKRISQAIRNLDKL